MEVCGSCNARSLDKEDKDLQNAKWPKWPKGASGYLSWENFLMAAGMVLCLVVAAGGGKALCITRGCDLYKGYSLAGLSMHFWGAAAFGLGLVLRLTGARTYRPYILVCFWGEILLVAWQVLSAPCSECLLVGLIWGLLAWKALREPVSQAVWASLWTAALVVVVLELAAPWPIYGKAGAPMRIFFAPGCSACQEEINKLAGVGDDVMANIALIPVARNEAEVAAVGRIARTLQTTGNFWLAMMQGMQTGGDSGQPWLSNLVLRLRLWGNKLLLGRMGVAKIPVAFSYGFEAKNGGDGGCGVVDAGHCD